MLNFTSGDRTGWEHKRGTDMNLLHAGLKHLLCASALSATLLGCSAALSDNSGAGAVSSGAGKTVEKKLHDGKFGWMALYLPWQDGGGFDALRSYHTKESEERPVKLEQVRDYALYCALGSNWDSIYSVLRVDSTGAAVAAYQDYTSRQYFQKSFRLTPAQMEQLNRCLRENNIGALAESYADLKAEQGTQGGITLVAAGQTRRTYFSNAWPEPARNLFTYLNAEVLRFRPGANGSGFAPAARTILQTDPEATLAVRGLIRGSKKSMQTADNSQEK